MTNEKIYKPKIVRARLRTSGKRVEDYIEDRRDRFRSEDEAAHIFKANELFDGLIVELSSWNWDNHQYWHLWNWGEESDRTIMRAMYEIHRAQTYELRRKGMKEFEKSWNLGECDAACSYCFTMDQAEVLEVIQEEENPNDSISSERIVRRHMYELQNHKARVRREQRRRRKGARV